MVFSTCFKSSRRAKVLLNHNMATVASTATRVVMTPHQRGIQSNSIAMSPRTLYTAGTGHAAHGVRFSLQPLAGDMRPAAQAEAVALCILIWGLDTAPGSLICQGQVAVLLFLSLGSIEQVGHYFLVSRRETVPATADCTFWPDDLG
ncbi:hypothetical protein D3C78_1568240 [compost metagenome]